MRFLLTMILLLSATTQAAGFPIDPERRAVVRATYQNTPPDILGLVEPVQVKEGGAYWDGGTSYTRLTDARKTEFLFYLDGRMYKVDPDVDTRLVGDVASSVSSSVSCCGPAGGRSRLLSGMR